MSRQPRVLVIRAAGTNCDRETAWAFSLAGASPETLHVNQCLEKPALLDSFDALAIPGGFSYGDDIASGKIFANQLRLKLLDPIGRLVARGGLVIGICNGFQVLVKSGLLGERKVTLTHNDHGAYRDEWVRMKVDGTRCVFLKGLGDMDLPIAHAEGRFMALTPSVFSELEKAGRLCLRYEGRNPNGSEGSVAGICDETGRIFGLMPHPERFLRFENHPSWTRLPKKDHGDGLALFTNAVEHLRDL
ncbi:MAG: phosphoribosylformylglycinamidine synthase subunit PurQ [Planctomycetota bacterium]